MDNTHPAQPSPMTTLRELRQQMPQLHPHAALTLTLDPMVSRGEITSEEYLQLAAHLIQAQGKYLFSMN